jgi:hypothetical protein
VVAIDPARRNLVDFAPAHLAADGFLTILVPPARARAPWPTSTSPACASPR